jgi:hypothetical protein
VAWCPVHRRSNDILVILINSVLNRCWVGDYNIIGWVLYLGDVILFPSGRCY